MKYSTCHICTKVKPSNEINFANGYGTNAQICNKCDVSHYIKQQSLINQKSNLKLATNKGPTWQHLVSEECRKYCSRNKIFIKDLTNEYFNTLRIKYKIPQNIRFHTIRNVINNYR
jgi:hypothetical protein